VKHLKQYETIGDDYSNLRVNQLKKYVLLKSSKNFVAIYKINNVNSYDNYIFTVFRCYKIDDNDVIQSNRIEKGGGLSFSFRFITNHLISQSDTVEPLIETAKLYIQTNKYNL